MRIRFKCKTNRDFVAINTVSFVLPTGSSITVDRTTTEWDIEGGILDMTWGCCYLWAVDGNTLFEEDVAYITDAEGFADLVYGTKAVFSLEEDTDEGYEVEIIEWSIEE